MREREREGGETISSSSPSWAYSSIAVIVSTPHIFRLRINFPHP